MSRESWIGIGGRLPLGRAYFRGWGGCMTLPMLVLAFAGGGQPPADRSLGLQPADILITGGTVITMDSQRRVLENAAIAIVGDRIEAIGPTEEIRGQFDPARLIDASRNVVMPGLIDGHGHAGHGLVKSLGTDTGEWYGATELIYARGSTEGFWRADALLTAVERLRFGLTTGISRSRLFTGFCHANRRPALWGRVPPSDQGRWGAVDPGGGSKTPAIPQDLFALGR